MAERLTQGNRIQDWAIAFKHLGFKAQAEKLSTDRLKGFRELERLNLPRYRSTTLPLTTFLDEPEMHFNKLDANKYWINLPPINPSLQRFRQIDLSRKDVTTFIEENIPTHQISNYNLHLSEYVKNLYGGNIVVSKDGLNVSIEMGDGVQSPIATGEKTPTYITNRDPFTGIFKYSFEDNDLRRAVWRTISAIPHDGEARDMKFLPGYYEFILAHRDSTKALEPIFLDYSSSSIYQMSE